MSNNRSRGGRPIRSDTELHSADPEMWREDSFAEVIDAIEQHEKSKPSHGFNCSCMDELIRKIRALTTAPRNDPKVQRRIDYIMRIAMSRRD